MAVPPGKPTAVAATAAEGSAVVSWQPPADPGDSSISQYTITAAPGGLTMTVGGSVRSVLASNLTNGTSYTFTVTATNSSGAGPASDPSPPVVPTAPTLPAAPSGVTAVARFEAATVTWTRPVSDGGRDIASYTVTADPGGAAVSVAAPVTEALLAGLTNGTAYRFTVVAHNEIGDGPASAPSAPVVPTPTIPDPPADVTASSSGDGTIHLSWQPPDYTGGQSVTGYTVAVTPGGTGVSAPGNATGVDVTGLAAGVEYSFTVAAVNGTGAGPASPASQPITPDAPRNANAKVLSAAALATLTSYSADGTLVFTDPPAEVGALQPGDVIVATSTGAAPEGFLRTVGTVVPDADTVTVTTTEAALADAVTAGGWSITDEITPDEGGPFVPAVPGVQLRHDLPAEPGRGKFVFEISTAIIPDRLTVTGSLTVSPLMQFSASLEGGISAKASFDARIEEKLTVKAEREVKPQQPVQKLIGQKDLGLRTIFIGGWPVLIRIKLEFFLTATGTAAVGVEGSLARAYTIGGGVEYRDGAFNTFKSDPNPTTEVKPLQATLSTRLQAGPQAKLSAFIYGTVGPAITLDSLLKLTVSPLSDPWAKVEVSIKLGIAFAFHVLKRELQFSATLFERTWLLWQSRGTFTGPNVFSVPVLAPNESIDLPISVDGDRRLTVSLPAGQPGKVINHFYVAPATAAEALLKADLPASGLFPATTSYVTVRTDPSIPAVPGVPTTVRIGRIDPDIEGHGGVVNLVFTAPLTSGSAPITQYAIFLNSSQFQWQVYESTDAGTNQRFQVLANGTYRLEIVACHNDGRSGPPLESAQFTVTGQRVALAGSQAAAGQPVALASHGDGLCIDNTR